MIKVGFSDPEEGVQGIDSGEEEGDHFCHLQRWGRDEDEDIPPGKAISGGG